MTPRILIDVTRLMLGIGDGSFRLFAVKTISRDLERLSVRLLVCDHASTLESSSILELTLADGIMR